MDPWGPQRQGKAPAAKGTETGLLSLLKAEEGIILGPFLFLLKLPETWPYDVSVLTRV